MTQRFTIRLKTRFLTCVFAAALPLNVVADPPTANIIDGTPTSETEYPFVARLAVDGELLCTGTLVGSSHILTAAHCFYDGRNRRAVGDTDVTVRLGGQTATSSKVYINPAYVPRSSACVEGETDAAIVELAAPISGIQTIPILESVVPVGATVLLAGYGTQGNGSTGEDGSLPGAGILNIGSTVVEGIGDNPPAQNPNSSYFYWTFNGGESNTASGDSGGPAFYQVSNQLYLAGLTCGGDGNAEIGTLSFDTRADLIRSWVLSITGETPSNTAPGFASLGTKSGSLGQAFSYRVPVTGSQPLTVTATGLPEGLSFDGSTITGTPLVAGTYTVQFLASNSFGTASADLTITISGFAPALTVTKALLQFDYEEGAEDFLDLTGRVKVGSKFRPRGKRVKIQIGRFTKTFRLDSNGQSLGSGISYFDLTGPFRGSAFRNQVVRFDLTLERVRIFDELSTLGFPASADASEGQEVALPLSVTINGIESSVTSTLIFRLRDERWKLK